MNRRRIFWTAIILLAVVTGSAIWLPFTAVLAIGSVLPMFGVAVLRGPRWRNGMLVLASVLLGLAGINLAFWIINPAPFNAGVVKTDKPEHWLEDDDVLGYRLVPGITVDAMSKYGNETLFHQTYAIDATGARITPGSGPDGPTYLFIGDSLIFSETLADSQTLASQFAQGLHPPAHVVNLGVPGYGLNNLVRAIETGQYDRYVVGKVAAAVTWIAPYHMERVTGEDDWLRWSPRYVLQSDGRLRFTGSFLGYRMTHPLEGAYYVARSHFGFVARAVHASLEREQTDLYIALLARLRDLLKERYGAPLVVITNWPESDKPGENDLAYVPAYQRIATLGIPLVSVRQIIGPSEEWHKYFVEHDGHPNAVLAGLVAKRLREVVTEH